MKLSHLCLLAWSLATPLFAQEEIVHELAGAYPLRARLSPWPAQPGLAHLIVDVDKPIEGTSALPTLTLQVMMDMPATPSMRATLTKVPRLRSGHYEGDLLLPMKGRWRLQFMLATPNGEYRVVSLVQVGPGGARPGKTTVPDDSCGPDNLTDPTVQMTCSPNPPRVGENRIRFQLPKEGKWKRVMVGLDMAGMPMSLLPQEATKKGDGHYEIDLTLPMSGVWQVRVDLDGRVPPPLLLNVNPAERRPLSQPLLWFSLAASVPLGVGYALRKRPLAPLITGLALAVSTFSAGAVIERYWPPEQSMEMSSPDPELNAPTPVLEAVVQRLPLSVYKKYPARVEPSLETVLTTGGGGTVWELAAQGVACKPGQRLGRVGSNSLLAPFSGVITRRLAEVGQSLTAGAPVLSLTRVDTVRVRARVPATDAYRVRRGQAVEVIDGDTLIHGQITTVSAISEEGEYWVESTLENVSPPVQMMSMSGTTLPPPRRGDDGGRPGTLPLGQKVLMRCLVEQLAPVLIVPKEALTDSEGRRFVMVVTPVAGQRVAHRREVSTGLSNDTHTAILSGLQEGEIVVALAQEQLSEGALVTPASWGVGTFRDLMIPSDAPHAQ